jgi:splicing factor U2AF subunit
MNPSALAMAGGAMPSMGGGGGASVSTTPSNLPGTRQARRLYVGNLPMPLTEQELKLFFCDAMRTAFPDLPGGESVVSIYLNHEKKFGFVEFRSPEEATTGMGLDGIMMKGMQLRIKRPSDYNPAVHGSAPSASRVPPPQPAQPQGQMGGGGAAGGNAPFNGVVSSQVPDGPNKVFMGGIPYSLSDGEVQELLSSFGQLRAFHLVKDRETNTSKGYCFFEYLDPSQTDIAVMGLNNLKIGDKTLTVRRAMPKTGGEQQQQQGGYGHGGDGMSALTAGMTPAQLGALAAMRAQGGLAPAAVTAPLRPPTRVLVLLQMVVPDMLVDEQEYREILEDIDLECRRYGEVRGVLIPRPDPSGRPVPGLGKVFVEFGAIEHAVKARAEVEGRQFDGRTVVADYWDEHMYANHQLD